MKKPLEYLRVVYGGIPAVHPGLLGILVGGDPIPGAVVQTFCRYHIGQQSKGLRSLGVKGGSVQDRLGHFLVGRDPGHALSSAKTRHEPDGCLGQAKFNSRIVGGKPCMGGQRHFEPTAESVTVNHRRNRFPTGFQSIKALHDIGHDQPQGLGRGIKKPTNHVQISPRMKGVLTGCDQNAFDQFAGRDFSHVISEFSNCGSREDVNLGARVIPTQFRNPIGVNIRRNDRIHAASPSIRSITIAIA